MATNDASLSPALPDILKGIQNTLQTIQGNYLQLAGTVEAIEGRVNAIAGIKEVKNAAKTAQGPDGVHSTSSEPIEQQAPPAPIVGLETAHEAVAETEPSPPARGSGNPPRIILTTYQIQYYYISVSSS